MLVRASALTTAGDQATMSNTAVSSESVEIKNDKGDNAKKSKILRMGQPANVQ
jgi:hypothetical protein